jgi:isopenicillin N synthase-like dioxygenase
VSTTIPTIDLEALGEGSPDSRAREAAALRTGLGHFGLVYVKNHGVSAENVDQLYDLFQALTSLPASSKAELGGRHVWFQRGWTPPNTEQAVVAGGQPDFKECYFAAPLDAPAELRAQYPQIYCENIWPAPSPSLDAHAFRERYLAMGLELHRAGEALLRGCALAFDLPESTFVEFVQGGPHVTRLLHYLPLAPEQVGTGILWGEEHTDFNLLTLLPGGRFYGPDKRACARPDDKSGLYLRTRPNAEAPLGSLVRGTAPAGCIVAQVGQQLEILTGGELLATPHVITPPGVPGFSRSSSAHFVHAQSNQTLFPLAPFRTPDAVREYSPPVLAGTYSTKTLVDIGLAPASAIDRFGYRQYGRLGSIRAAELG